MHETERHRVILAAAQSRPVVTVGELCDVTGSSEATIRRDIASMHVQGKLRRVRGGAEAISPPEQGGLGYGACRVSTLEGVCQVVVDHYRTGGKGTQRVVAGHELTQGPIVGAEYAVGAVVEKIAGGLDATKLAN